MRLDRIRRAKLGPKFTDLDVKIDLHSETAAEIRFEIAHDNVIQLRRARVHLAPM